MPADLAHAAAAPALDPAAVEAVAGMMGAGAFQVDARRTVTAITPQMEALTGYTAAEVVGRSCLDLLRCRECLRGCALFRLGRLEPTPMTIYRKDGAEIEVERAGLVLRGADGAVSGAVETVRALGSGAPAPDGAACGHAPPPELDSLLSSLGRGWVVADGELRVMACAPSIAALAGADAPERLRGAPLAGLFGDELFGAEGALRGAVARGERREGWRAALRGPDGRHTPVSLSVGAVEADGHCGRMGARVMVMVRPDGAEPADPSALPLGIVARSAAMRRIVRLVEQLRETDATVLLTGESGTGKERVAQALHAASHRARGPFVAVNCAALPAELLEAELFGHVRGAFTGAVRDRVGRFELAAGGTLFLDEIGDLAPSLQAKLLRVLQERTYERVGESRSRRAEVRVIAATHVNLARAVAEGRFRDDLYYRLRVVPVEIPPLRERREDVLPLAELLLERIGTRRGRALRLSPSATRALLAYDWPGTVRELENALEYATALCAGQTIHLADLPAEVALGAPEPGPAPDPAPLPAAEAPLPSPAPERPPVVLTADEAAAAGRIRAALARTRYRRDEAARLLGMSRTTLWRKMTVYRI